MPFVSVLFPLAVDQAFTYYIKDFNDNIGSRILAPFGKNNHKRVGIAIGIGDEIAKYKQAVILEKTPVVDETSIKLIYFMHDYYGSNLGIALKAMLPKKLFELKEPIDMKTCACKLNKPIEHLFATEEQKKIIDAIVPQVANKFSPNLIMGVTGSGKTEIYLQLVENALKLKSGAIILVPEISLTPQLEERFLNRFGDIVSIFHSRLTPLERYKRWLEIKKGEKLIALGARSAIFAPIKPGIIVVDEEQDGSYKQSDMMPHYNGRDIAILRAKFENIPIVLGSATPSVSTYYNAKMKKFRFFKLENRIGKVPLPKIYIVDMKKETGLISKQLIDALKLAKQAVILINRRGFSRFTVCLECGKVLSCPNCSVALTYHKQDETLRCHWCGYSQKKETGCACKSKTLKFVGTGTEKIVQQLKELFPHKTVARFDSDSMAKKGSYRNILNRIKSGDIDIIVGTQMVAHGHDYPKIMVSAILTFESLLAGSDYLASYRAVELAIQASGRAGRREQGISIIQTYDTHNPLFTDIIRHDYAGFCEKELKIRAEHAYPPFSHLIRVIFINQDKRTAKNDAINFKNMISAKNSTIIGPSECIIVRIRNRFRFHFIIKTEHVKSSVKQLRHIVDNADFDSRIYIDVDAIDFY